MSETVGETKSTYVTNNTDAVVKALALAEGRVQVATKGGNLHTGYPTGFESLERGTSEVLMAGLAGDKGEHPDLWILTDQVVSVHYLEEEVEDFRSDGSEMEALANIEFINVLAAESREDRRVVVHLRSGKEYTGKPAFMPNGTVKMLCGATVTWVRIADIVAVDTFGHLADDDEDDEDEFDKGVVIPVEFTDEEWAELHAAADIDHNIAVDEFIYKAAMAAAGESEAVHDRRGALSDVEIDPREGGR